MSEICWSDGSGDGAGTFDCTVDMVEELVNGKIRVPFYQT